MKHEKKNKSYQKRSAVLLILLLLFLTLIGCGVKEETEEEIKSDVTNYFTEELANDYLSGEFSLTEFQITDRETSQKDKIDWVWISLTLVAENYEIAVPSVILEYTLQNKQWTWTNTQLFSEMQTTVIPTVTEEQAATQLADKDYDELTFENRVTD